MEGPAWPLLSEMARKDLRAPAELESASQRTFVTADPEPTARPIPLRSHPHKRTCLLRPAVWLSIQDPDELDGCRAS